MCELELMLTNEKDETECNSVQLLGNKQPEESRRLFLQGQVRYKKDWDAILLK